MISKSDFLLYLGSPIHFWAKINGQINLDSSSLFENFLKLQGMKIEKLAEKQLHKKFDGFEILSQKTFTSNNFSTRPDILIKNPTTHKYDIYEIKSSSSIKKEHKYDVTFQQIVCSGTIQVGNTYIVHLNKEYTKEGEIDFSNFFKITKMNDVVSELSSEVRNLMAETQHISLMETSTELLGCTKPTACPSPDLCHPNLPEHPIYEISRIGKKALKLRDEGVLAIKDIPEGFPLTSRQSAQVRSVKKCAPIIDKESIEGILNKLIYPLYFLDYETFNPAIPLYDGYSPYQHITFQFSLHVINTSGDHPQHFEYLHADNTDPANKLVSQLMANLGNQGSVIVWNKSFEKGRNADMARLLPDYKDFLEGINDRLFDLMDVFSKTHFVHPDFEGSASLKKVLPALMPELSYSGLTISQGDQAMMAWKDLIRGKFTSDEKQELIIDMLKYCELDTFAMVEILRYLQKTIVS